MYIDWDGDAWSEREKIDKKERVVTNRDFKKVYWLALFLSEGCGSKKVWAENLDFRSAIRLEVEIQEGYW